jgi:hypothetical protein
MPGCAIGHGIIQAQRAPEVSMIDRVTRTVTSSMAAGLLAIGALLVVVAFFAAGLIPQQAHRDFDRLVVSMGGGMSHTPTYPDVYRQMSANRRMLQNAYVGGSGLILLTAGAFGLSVQRRS